MKKLKYIKFMDIERPHLSVDVDIGYVRVKFMPIQGNNFISMKLK